MIRSLVACPRRPRADGGYTLLELMIVVAILGILAAIATPSLTRDSRFEAGRRFASGLARELQRARVQAVSDRVPIRVFLFKNRVELRSWVLQGTPPVAQVPLVSNPLLAVVPAPPGGVTIADVQGDGNAAVPTGQVLGAGVNDYIQFDFRINGGSTFIGGTAGALAPAVSAGTIIYVLNNDAPAGHLYRRMRLTVGSLTGYVSVAETW